MKPKCKHPGCKSHVTHPCEECGYQAAKPITEGKHPKTFYNNVPKSAWFKISRKEFNKSRERWLKDIDNGNM